MMSPVSGRDFVAPHSERPVRELLLCVYACVQDVQSEVSPRLGSRAAPSLAMSNDAAAERGSQPAQRDELAHSQTVPIGDEVLPLTIDTSPPATTGILESLHGAHYRDYSSLHACKEEEEERCLFLEREW